LPTQVVVSDEPKLISLTAFTSPQVWVGEEDTTNCTCRR